jgi:hypothetical protein
MVRSKNKSAGMVEKHTAFACGTPNGKMKARYEYGSIEKESNSGAMHAAYQILVA